MTRLYGRAPRGERVTESVPRNYGAQTSLIGTISLSGVEAVMTVEGAVDTDVFDAYVEQVLGPTIRRGDVMVLDNLSAHHASRIEEVAGERGASVIRLSPYSPDFSPIELMWSKIKTLMRAAKAGTREELERGLTAALRLVTESDCRGRFTHCGYWVTSNCNCYRVSKWLVSVRKRGRRKFTLNLFSPRTLCNQVIPQPTALHHPIA
jgi:transposase